MFQFNKYWLNNYYVSGTILDSGETEINVIGLHKFVFQEEREGKEKRREGRRDQDEFFPQGHRME